MGISIESVQDLLTEKIDFGLVKEVIAIVDEKMSSVSFVRNNKEVMVSGNFCWKIGISQKLNDSEREEVRKEYRDKYGWICNFLLKPTADPLTTDGCRNFVALEMPPTGVVHRS